LHVQKGFDDWYRRSLHQDAVEALVDEHYVKSGNAAPADNDGLQLVLIGHTLAPSSYKVAATSKMSFEQLFAQLEEKLIGIVIIVIIIEHAGTDIDPVSYGLSCECRCDGGHDGV